MKIGGWAPHELHDHEAEEVARDQAEGVRLAYVAATRARDLLVVPALGDEPVGGRLVRRRSIGALYPPLDATAQRRRGAPKCPAFKSKDTVPAAAERGNRGAVDRCARRACVRRGRLFGGLVGSRRRRRPDLGVKPLFGVRRDDLIVKDVPRDVVADGRTRYDRWWLARADARAAGASPSLVVRTAKEWADDDGAAALSGGRGRERRGARRCRARRRRRIRRPRPRGAVAGAVRCAARSARGARGRRSARRSGSSDADARRPPRASRRRCWPTTSSRALVPRSSAGRAGARRR